MKFNKDFFNKFKKKRNNNNTYGSSNNSYNSSTDNNKSKFKNIVNKFKKIKFKNINFKKIKVNNIKKLTSPYTSKLSIIIPKSNSEKVIVKNIFIITSLCTIIGFVAVFFITSYFKDFWIFSKKAKSHKEKYDNDVRDKINFHWIMNTPDMSISTIIPYYSTYSHEIDQYNPYFFNYFDAPSQSDAPFPGYWREMNFSMSLLPQKHCDITWKAYYSTNNNTNGRFDYSYNNNNIIYNLPYIVAMKDTVTDETITQPITDIWLMTVFKYKTLDSQGSSVIQSQTMYSYGFMNDGHALKSNYYNRTGVKYNPKTS